ncbi:hypothetical protein C5S31_07185 [ANME-1 cluster archaeon GoMg2]|nr:hypothetical protein [ANME-1 cluster archaeon GoMg2]
MSSRKAIGVNGILIVTILLVAFVSTASAVAMLIVTPDTATSGDFVAVVGTGFNPSETVTINSTVSDFEIPIQNGKYEYSLVKLNISEEKTSFSFNVKKVNDDMVIHGQICEDILGMLVCSPSVAINTTSYGFIFGYDAANKTAQVSRGMPSHTGLYNIEVTGTAVDGKVFMGITVNYEVETNSTGGFELVIDTFGIPGGVYTIIAEGAGGSADATLSLEGQPDLVITDIWYENNTICYNIKNYGTARADASHSALYKTVFLRYRLLMRYKASDSVKALAPGESYNGSFPTYDWTCRPPADTVKVCADYNKEVAESNENNCLEKELVCPRPDLKITAILKENGKVYYNITNEGEASSEKSYTGLFIDGKHTASDNVKVLAPGESSNGSFSFVCSPPNNTIRVCADYKNNIVESDEGNNCIEEVWDCLLPDLNITDIWYSGNTIYYNITNEGTASSGASYTGLYIDGKFKASDYVESLDVSSTSTGSFMYYDWSCSNPPTDIIKVCADYDSKIAELDEGNNCIEEVWNCLLPDLNITDIWYSGNTIYYNITNEGTASAGASYTGLYKDTWLRYRIYKQYLVSDWVGPLDPGVTSTGAFAYNWTCTPPDDTIKVCADYKKWLIELNESNNCREEIWTCP